MNINNINIAIIHDWFLKKSFSGSEKVTILLDKVISKNHSKPDIFSLTSNLGEIENKLFNGRKIQTSFIQNLPFGKNNVQKYLPLLPIAIEQIDLSKYELIISSSHAISKGVITNPNQLHVSYIHTPMRYAWDQMNTYLNQKNFFNYGLQIPTRYILYKLREWDFISSQRIDFLISNSNFTAKRIKKYWGLKSQVIHPPVDVERFNFNNSRDNFYLSVNRLVPNKRIDLLIDSFNILGLPLIIIGDGPERIRLEKRAKSNIKFLKKISDIEVANYLSKCRAFVYAGLEDFGIAPVEAMASGAPIIAYGKGGILDTVNCLTNQEKNEIPTGILFKKQTSADIVDAISWFEERKIWRKFNSQNLNNHAQKFTSKNFSKKFEFFLDKAWDNFKKN